MCHTLFDMARLHLQRTRRCWMGSNRRILHLFHRCRALLRGTHARRAAVRRSSATTLSLVPCCVATAAPIFRLPTRLPCSSRDLERHLPRAVKCRVAPHVGATGRLAAEVLLKDLPTITCRRDGYSDRESTIIEIQLNITPSYFNHATSDSDVLSTSRDRLYGETKHSTNNI